MKMFIAVETATGKTVPFIDVTGHEWEYLTDWRTAVKAIAGMNREAGPKTYKLESL